MLKNTFLRIIVFTVFIFAYQVSVCETLKFEHFSNKEGFNQNTINAIVEDKYGFLWFGTPNGLIKYDGYDFYNFNHDPLSSNSISNNYIQCLFTDSEGNLWIGTRAGINVYLPQLEKFFKVPVYSNLVVRQITANAEGRIWISGTNALFSCKLNIVKDSVSFDVSENLLKTDNILSAFPEICFIDDTHILSHKSLGLFSVEVEVDSPNDAVKLKSIKEYSALANSKVNVIHKSDNIFWVGTNNGLFKIIIDGERIRIMEKFELTTWDNRIISDFFQFLKIMMITFGLVQSIMGFLNIIVNRIVLKISDIIQWT